MIAFSGNNDTACVEDENGQPLTGNALLAKYKADAESVMADFTPGQTEVLWVTPPGHVGDDQEPALGAVYREVVNEFPNAMLVDGGKYLRDATGTYQLNLPCWSDEQPLSSCQNGQIDVRLLIDGFHFCPVLVSALTPCPVYDAGAARYGRAMAEPVDQLLGP